MEGSDSILADVDLFAEDYSILRWQVFLNVLQRFNMFKVLDLEFVLINLIMIKLINNVINYFILRVCVCGG